jgi:hypothetical protein
VASERNPVGLVPMLLQYVQKAESELHRSNPNPVVPSLVNFRNDRDWTPLHAAAWYSPRTAHTWHALCHRHHRTRALTMI